MRLKISTACSCKPTSKDDLFMQNKNEKNLGAGSDCTAALSCGPSAEKQLEKHLVPVFRRYLFCAFSKT